MAARLPVSARLGLLAQHTDVVEHYLGYLPHCTEQAADKFYNLFIYYRKGGPRLCTGYLTAFSSVLSWLVSYLMDRNLESYVLPC